MFSLIDGNSSGVGWLEPQGQNDIRIVAEAAVGISVLPLGTHSEVTLADILVFG